MSGNLPYLVSPGTLKTALDKIRAAATPERVTGDFVANMLLIKGGSGKAILPYLKKIGFVASDGTPTEIYKRFRNKDQGPLAAADAVRFGYKELGQVNEAFYTLDENQLRSLILQVSGQAADSTVARLIHSTLAVLISYAKFEEESATPDVKTLQENHIEPLPTFQKQHFRDNQQIDFKLAYTINLNLPATTDQAVFNAIFKSLKEHLLDDNE